MTETTVPRSRPVSSAQVIFAGGGTGGHLYPGLAIAEQLPADIDTAFLCSDKSLDADILTEAEVSFQPIPARPFLFRPFPMGPIRFLRRWFSAMQSANRVLNKVIRECGSADAITVVLLGGYVAAPVARAAAQRGIHVLLVNLDVVPGKANRLAARWADEIISAVACAAPPRFTQANVVGMPIRKQAVSNRSPSACRTRLGLNPELKTLLITGASQGAGSLNDLLAALVNDPESRPAFADWQLLHLAGPNQAANLRAAYESANLPAQVLPYCHDMGSAWGAADLALSRAGASSVAEAALNQIPTIFAPYPFHADEHQKFNAEPIVKLGGGWLVRDANNIRENLGTIGRTLCGLLTDSQRRATAVSALQQAAWPNAAVTIAELIRRRSNT